METKTANLRKNIRIIIALILTLVTLTLLTSCDEKSVVELDVINCPDTIYVEEFDADLKNISEALNACDIKLNVKYDDGSTEEIPLTFDMLENEKQLELNSEGLHYLSYSYKGETIDFKLSVQLVQMFTVRFYDNNNNIISEQKVRKAEAAVEPTEAERNVEGYTFVKWDRSFGVVTRDLDIYGIYEVNSYTVTFYDNNSNVISEQNVKYGESAVEPSEDERAVEGCNFIGWDKDFSKITGDLDVYGIYDENAYTVRFYDNNNNIISEQRVKHGKDAVEPSAAERDVVGYLFIEWDVAFNNVTADLDVRGVYEKMLVVTFYNCNNELIDTKYVAKNGNVEEPSDSAKYVPGYKFLTWDKELTNITKDISVYGVYTNDNVTDTDGDGIIDYIEIKILNLDYTKVDTDGDGITDDKEDYDNDGLSNLTEIKSGLDPANPDTDGDGLTDGDEVDVYWTLPEDPDTDGDGAYDGWEINNGFDPLDYNDTFEVKTTVEMPDETEIAIEIPEISGEFVNTPIIEASTDEAIKEIHGSIGDPIQYNITASAEITITSEEIVVAEDPVLMYFNTETKQVEPIPVSVNGNEATASITKYGNYVLVDRKVFEEKGQWRDVFAAGSYSSIEIVLVIDDSGSLGGDYGYNSSTGYFSGGNDPQHKRLEAARDFIEKSTSSVKIGIVKFDSSVSVVQNLTQCTESGKDTLQSYLKIRNGTFDSSGTTYMYKGMQTAMTQFTNSPNTLKVMVVFTDGQAHDRNLHSSVIEEATENGIRIYTVGLGSSSSYFSDYLKPLANETGGKFYDTGNASDLVGIFTEIKEKIDMETDSDEDGLPDFFESGVDANGNPTLPVINGMSFEGLDKLNPDTDEDGYLDGEEIEIYQYYSDTNPNQVMIWGIVNSNPLDPESVPKSKE